MKLMVRFLAAASMSCGLVFGVAGSAPASTTSYRWYPWGYYQTLSQCNATGAAIYDPPDVVDYRCTLERYGPHPGWYHLYIASQTP